MKVLDTAMNGIVSMTESKSFFKKEVLSRTALIGVIPLEMLNVLRLTMKLPFQGAGLALKVAPWTIGQLMYSPSMEAYQRSLSGPMDILKTVFKIVGCVFGILSSCTIGLILPETNVKFHDRLGLIINKKEELEKQALDEEACKNLSRQLDEIRKQLEALSIKKA